MEAVEVVTLLVQVVTVNQVAQEEVLDKVVTLLQRVALEHLGKVMKVVTLHQIKEVLEAVEQVPPVKIINPVEAVTVEQDKQVQ